MTAKDKATRAEKLIENYVRTKVRSMLKEDETDNEDNVFKITRWVGSHGWQVGKWTDEKAANAVLAFLKKMSKYEPNPERTVYKLTKGEWS